MRCTCPAGLMALARANGQRVVCVTATRGELGTADPAAWPPERLAAERTRELADCLAVLGVHEHHWLGYRDCGCAAADAPISGHCSLPSDASGSGRTRCSTFGPDGLTGHPDHRAVSAWTGAAFAAAAPRGPGCCTPRSRSAARCRATSWASTLRATRSERRTRTWPSTSCWKPSRRRV